jgi:hypothetical protein
MSRTPRISALPDSLPPLGLSREAAAEYIGVSPSKLDDMVRDGRMPPPIAIDARRVWDRELIRQAFKRLVAQQIGDEAAAKMHANSRDKSDPDDLPGWDDI